MLGFSGLTGGPMKSWMVAFLLLILTGSAAVRADGIDPRENNFRFLVDGVTIDGVVGYRIDFIRNPVTRDDQRRLGALIGEWSQNKSELAWVEKLRAASAAQYNKPAFWRFKRAGVIGLLTVSLAVAAYLLGVVFLK